VHQWLLDPGGIYQSTRLPDPAAQRRLIDMKFRSCMTLFSLVVDNPDNPFRHALDRWCGGQLDEQTLALVDAAG
jgi:uncharacterized protein (DUF1810 family)